MYVVVNKNKKKIVKIDEEMEVQIPSNKQDKQDKQAIPAVLEGFKLPLVNVEVSWWVFLLIIILIVLIGVLIFMAFKGDSGSSEAPIMAPSVQAPSMAPSVQVPSVQVPSVQVSSARTGAKKRKSARPKKRA